MTDIVIIINAKYHSIIPFMVNGQVHYISLFSTDKI